MHGAQERWEDPNVEYFVRDAKTGGGAQAGQAGEAAMLHEKELEIDAGDASENKVCATWTACQPVCIIF